MRHGLIGAILLAGWAGAAIAATDRFAVFNMTATTDFSGVSLAPAGTQDWGPNQALNDPDKELQHGERLRLRGVTRGRYDVKFSWGDGKTCIKRDVDLTRDPTFDIRDDDLAKCR